MSFKFEKYALGGFGDNTVVDVDALPTENIDQSKIYRVTSGTETTYGIPDEADNKTVYEHTSASGWTELGAGGGGEGGGSGIIDVTELPTENIDENAVYRSSIDADEGWMLYAVSNVGLLTISEYFETQMGTMMSVSILVVDALPETPTAIYPDSSGVVHIPAYLLRETERLYLSQDGATYMEFERMLFSYEVVDTIDDIDVFGNDKVYLVRGRSQDVYGVPKNDIVLQEYAPSTNWENVTQKNELLYASNKRLEAVANTINSMELSGSDTTITLKKIFIPKPHHTAVIPSFVTRLGNRCFAMNIDGCYVETLYLPKTVVYFLHGAFGESGGYAINLKTINYGGTKSDWNAIQKSEDWMGDSTAAETRFNVTVHCTDGDIVYVEGVAT